MGPSVILDKSAVEAIGREAMYVQSEYFYTVVTPVLVWEICGDIEKARQGKCDPDKVRALAGKAKPLNSIVTTDWRKLVTMELSGYRFDEAKGAERRARVDGAHHVPLPGGGVGSIIEEQPEAMALLRWHFGEWTPSDVAYAHEWRRITRETDLEALRKRFGAGFRSSTSLDELRELVDRLLGDSSLQYFLFSLLAEEVTPQVEARQGLLRRWRGIREWPSHAWYSRHCIRVFLTFYLSLAGKLVGTRATNRVDIEYFLYLPFAPIFVSGDDGTHSRLAPILLATDQTFIRATDFRRALQDEAERTAALRAGNPNPDPDALEPPESSLIQKLWVDVRGAFRLPPSKRPKTDPAKAPKAATIAEEFDRAMNHVKARPQEYPKRPAWPHL